MAIPWRKLRIPGITLVLAIIVFLLVKPIDNADALNRCQDLYQRGEYTACSRVLTKRLARNPDWIEGRELIVQAQLADQDFLAALPHHLYLLETGQTGIDLFLLRGLAQLDQDSQQEARELMEGILDAKPALDNSREFAFRFELEAENIPGGMNHLYILYTSAASSRELESMAASSCNDYTQWEQFLDALLEKSPRLSWPQEMKLLYALEHEDIDLAGKILAETEDLRPVSEDLVADIVAFALERNLAVALDAAAKSGQDNLLDTVLRQVEMLTPSQLKSQLPPLLSLLPEEPRLQILNAFYLLPPSHGLDLLLGLDGKGYVPENPQEFFKIITCMLHQVENLPGEPPWTSTLDDIVMTYILNNHHVLLRLADYVEAFYSESDASMLRAIANHGKPVPKVIWQRPKVYPTGLRLSPDGKWLICNFKLSTGSEIVIVNLDTGKETTIKSPYHIGSWYWSPDSSRAAAGFLKGQDSIA